MTGALTHDPIPHAVWVSTGTALPHTDVPLHPPDGFRTGCIDLVQNGGRLAALCAIPSCSSSPGDVIDVLAIIARDADAELGLLRTTLPQAGSCQSLSPELPQAQAFERELLEEHGITCEGHPWLKPLRRHADLEAPSKEEAATGRAPYTFFRVEGQGIHEVAVGPVHAGIIEPGHFRFQCHGERVHHLEIQLGYQHRGAEALLLRSAPERQLVVAESIAGDTVVGHALTYCMTIEALANTEAPLYAQAVRGIALELERLSNHVGDLGALCNDVGYLPGASWFGRLRGVFLNHLMELSGNRYGRSLLKPGGVRHGFSVRHRKELLASLTRAERDLGEIAEATFDAPTVCARFDHTGVVPLEMAETLGLVGPVARASGCDRDVRRDHPFGIFRFAYIPVAQVDTGDVMARALLRWLETQRSIAFVREQLNELPEESLCTAVPVARLGSICVSMVEGWRGEILHVAVTSAEGRLATYKIVDPSFHNWFALAMAMRNNPISDFPLCNKSFNLSYAGHDL